MEESEKLMVGKMTKKGRVGVGANLIFAEPVDVKWVRKIYGRFQHDESKGRKRGRRNLRLHSDF